MKILKHLLMTLCFVFFASQFSYSQIIAPTGEPARASSQQILFYDLVFGTSDVQVTNTSATEDVTIHVQIFRSFDIDGPAGAAPPTLCDERDFFDVLTPTDTHVYTLTTPMFVTNNGETAAPTPGLPTTIDLTNPVPTKGFVIITPVVSATDATAISFQNLVATTRFIGSLNDELNAMGRDAVDLTSGEILPDGTVLDGVSTGFVTLQPEELAVDFGVIATPADLVGFAFIDNYGPAGLLGYNIIPGEITWTSFVFDFIENPTSCGNNTVSCFLSIGINDTYPAFNTSIFDDELCSGTTTPMSGVPGASFYGWISVFASGYSDGENHLALIADSGFQSARWMYVKGERTEPNPNENCAVAGDEDGDMLADCADPDCVGLAGPNGETCEAAEATCDDGFDNDGDGATDGADTDCDGSESCPSCESGDQCSDGEDNDGDGNSDCADGGCDGATGPNGETCEAGVELTCNDNQDNDGDGTADCDDPDCAIATNCVSGDGGGGGGGCSVAATANPSMLNFLLPMIAVGLFVGVRRRIRN